MKPLVTVEALAQVGRSNFRGRGVVAADHIRKFCLGIDDPNPLYLDREAAQRAGYPDIIAPPLFNAAVTRPLRFRAELLPDGQYHDLAPPGLNHLQSMLAGQTWELTRPTSPGEELIEHFGMKAITEKEGSTGGMALVEQESVITTGTGELIERTISTLVMRPPPPSPGPDSTSSKAGEISSPVPAYEGAPGAALIKHPDMIQLFMFAAAIWAVHRIHWDTPYSQKEGLRLPVLPGWMTSSYLAQLAMSRAPAGGRIKTLAVRYKGSAYPGDTLHCREVEEHDGAAEPLSVINQHGQTIAAATVTYQADGG